MPAGCVDGVAVTDADGYLLSCPWCGADMRGKISQAQMQHLIDCGDKFRGDTRRANAATRAETIEECAKVAENNNSWPQEGEEIAAEIRALGGAR
jgi:hypothetical protein